MEVAFVCRRELKEVINSSAAGESPKRFFKWSAAASFDRLAEYAKICSRDSLSSGRIFEMRGSAHEVRLADMLLLESNVKKILVCEQRS